MGEYFTPLGDFATLDERYNFVTEKTYDNTVYGIPNGGTAGGVAYNKKVWKEAGVTELPATPDEFLEDLQLIKDKTDAVPLYTNFSAGWTMGAWNDYVGIASNADADYKNNKLLHQKDPFTKNEEMSGRNERQCRRKEARYNEREEEIFILCFFSDQICVADSGICRIISSGLRLCADGV